MVTFAGMLDYKKIKILYYGKPISSVVFSDQPCFRWSVLIFSAILIRIFKQLCQGE